MAEIPERNRAALSLKDDVAVVGVLVFSGTPPHVDGDLAKLGIQYPVWVTDDVSAQRWNVSAVPTSFLLDGAGVVRWSSNGGVDEQEVREAVASLKNAH